jgi:7,8-dihydroneopterin aldolase/epimerase/oxygenase
MSDRILLANMAFDARHGVAEWEKREAQRFEVDVELGLDLQPAGLDDDLAKTVDYGPVYDTVRQVVESTTYNLLEALAEALCHQLLAEQPRVREIRVRVRKPGVRLGGPLDFAGVEITRQRSGEG